MSQPAREFVVKIVELGLWSSDFLLGHVLLFMLTPPLLVPYFDRLHATSGWFVDVYGVITDMFSSILFRYEY